MSRLRAIADAVLERPRLRFAYGVVLLIVAGVEGHVGHLAINALILGVLGLYFTASALFVSEP